MVENFETKDELFSYLKANKKLLIDKKKSAMKKADAISIATISTNDSKTNKSIDLLDSNVEIEQINVEVVINTTNILDSHSDVHIPGIWNKTLKEKKPNSVYLLQEHEMTFDHVISDDVVASTKTFNFSEIGFPEYKGTTEALVFNATIDDSRNEFMFEQYCNGYVKQHSVGMMYVTLFLCINSDKPAFKEEKDNWDKYIKYVANAQDAIDNGYFWAVTEAKLIEGSAVVMGSNQVTPTISISVPQNQIEAELVTSTTNEPIKTTQINYNYLLNNLKK